MDTNVIHDDYVLESRKTPIKPGSHGSGSSAECMHSCVYGEIVNAINNSVSFRMCRAPATPDKAWEMAKLLRRRLRLRKKTNRKSDPAVTSLFMNE